MLEFALILVVAVLPFSSGSGRHTIVVSQFKYAPSTLQIAVGDTVVFENRDVVPHTASAKDKTWDSGDIPARARRVVVVREKGEQTYDCLYHSNMKGKLIVR